MSKRMDFFKITIGSCKFMQLAFSCKYICVHGFDWSTNPILLKIDIHVGAYVLWWRMSQIIDFFKIIICSCKFMQLPIFLQINMCARF